MFESLNGNTLRLLSNYDGSEAAKDNLTLDEAISCLNAGSKECMSAERGKPFSDSELQQISEGFLAAQIIVSQARNRESDK